TVASGAFMPARTFGAPQTICSSSAPEDTRQTLSFSASGCLSTLRTSPTTTPARSGAARSTASISRPAMVSACASAGTSSPVLTHSRSHCRLILMRAPSRELPEEAQVVLEIHADVVDVVTQHRQAIDAHAEGVAGVSLGIDVHRPQHVR